MRNLIAGSLAATALSFVLTAAPALAADPTVDQIYGAVRAGHLADAQQMMDQVLRAHPDSAKAHYVQAELYAREGNPGLARSELARAEQIKPGLPDVNPESVRELKQELGLQPRSGAERTFGGAPAAESHRFPWGAVILLLVVIAVFAMLFRRRTYVQYPAGGAPMGPGGYGPGYGPGGGYGPAPGGGIGSNIAGGLAGGLAAGAGIVAGEELAHHFLDGNERAVAPPPRDDDEFRNANSDMGGGDFGVNDPGSWGDGSGGGDFGSGGGDSGGDWS